VADLIVADAARITALPFGWKARLRIGTGDR
jgi:hypothetical protein